MRVAGCESVEAEDPKTTLREMIGGGAPHGAEAGYNDVVSISHMIPRSLHASRLERTTMRDEKAKYYIRGSTIDPRNPLYRRG